MYSHNGTSCRLLWRFMAVRVVTSSNKVMFSPSLSGCLVYLSPQLLKSGI